MNRAQDADDVHRLIRAAWSMCVEEQAAKTGWGMAKKWAFNNLRDACQPFLAEDRTLLIDGESGDAP